MSDGRAGMANQVLGLAEAIARLTPAEVAVKTVGYRAGYDRLPTALQAAPRLFLRDPGAFAPPWPDLWIAAGRATLPLSERLRGWSGGRTFVVQLQDPRRPLHRFDLVAPPEHDGLEGPNVFPILGAPHRVTPERLAAARETLPERFAGLPAPLTVALIGGPTKRLRFDAEVARTLGRELAALATGNGGAVAALTSRRTPPAAAAALAEALRGTSGWVWRGEADGPNPYLAALARADRIVVTADTTTMAVEAATTGKPLLLAPLPGTSPKHARLHATLADRAALKLIGAAHASEAPAEALNETTRLAAHILRSIQVRQAA